MKKKLIFLATGLVATVSVFATDLNNAFPQDVKTPTEVKAFDITALKFEVVEAANLPEALQEAAKVEGLKEVAAAKTEAGLDVYRLTVEVEEGTKVVYLNKEGKPLKNVMLPKENVEQKAPETSETPEVQEAPETPEVK